MTQFIKTCPSCGQNLVEKLQNVDVKQDLKACYAESIPVLVCENPACTNQEKYYSPFSFNLLKMKCPEINKW